MASDSETGTSPPRPGARGVLRSIGRRCAGAFAVDLRSLAAFRIGLGVLLLVDLAFRAVALEAHYADTGVLPRAAFREALANPYAWSFHLWHGAPAAQALLFGAHAVLAMLLVLGWHTRIATIGCWVLLLSLHHRNPFVLIGGDLLFRLLFLWAAFLPLGARISIDALRRPALRRAPVRLVSPAAAACLLQVAFVYWFTALFKNNPGWRSEGAVFHALATDHYATPFTHWLLDAPPALFAPMSLLVLLVEGLVPFLAFSPFRNAACRMAAVAVFAGLHATFALFLQIGLFPAVMLVAWLPFLPSELWDGLRRGAPGGARRLAAASAHAIRVLALRARRHHHAFLLRGRPTRLAETAAVLLLAFVFVVNLDGARRTLAPERSRILPLTARNVVRAAGLEQNWAMFAPTPSRADGWYVAAGTLRNGERVDVWRDIPLTWDKPARVSTVYPTDRWRKYIVPLATKTRKQNLPRFLDYLCRNWNGSHHDGETLVRVEIVFMSEPSLDGFRIGAVTPHLLERWDCDGGAEPAADLVAAAKAASGAHR